MLSVYCNCGIKLKPNYKGSTKDKNNKPFIDQYNWEEIDLSSHKKDWKKFELNNKSIALNILYVLHNAEEIRHDINQNII